MTALTGTVDQATAETAVHPATAQWQAPSERRTPVPQFFVGLAFGVVGALLLAIGGVGLPIALAVVQGRQLVTPDQQPALDAAIRLAPIFFVLGVVHLVVAAGLIAGTAWARIVGMAFAASVSLIAVVGMVVAGSKLDPFAPVTSQVAASSTSDGIAILGFIVVAYAAAFVTLLVARRR